MSGPSVKMKNSWAMPATQCLKLGRRRVARPETVQKRGLQDVQITRTGRPILRVQGGRYEMHMYTGKLAF